MHFVLLINFPKRLINSINCGDDIEATQRESRKNDNTICIMHNGTCDHFQLCVCSITPSNHLMHILQPIQCTHTHTNTHFASTAHQYSNVQSIGLSQIASHTNFNPCQAHYFRWKLFLFPTMLTSNVFVIQALNIKYILIDDTVRLK